MLPNNKFPSDQPLGKEQLKTVWTSVSGDLQAALGEASFELWFGQSCLLKVDENQAVISSPGSMYAIWIEENFRDMLKVHLDKYLLDLKGFSLDYSQSGDDPVDLAPLLVDTGVDDFPGEPKVVRKKKKSARLKRPLSQEEIIEKGIESGLNEAYCFDNFVVGEHSKIANAAALAVVETPGTTYQPLFFHSGSGLGKTHLLHAIGWAFLKRRPHAKVCYVGAEKFANEYVDAIRNSKDTAFRKKYREVEMLLLDDVQFLGGKSGFQREFFHTFNSIMDQRNQIVIASDCLASEITQLEERLISRMQWGMTVEIDQPDQETAEAILRQKRDDLNLNTGDEVITKIVRRVSSNVRQLEGALIRTSMVASLNGGTIGDEELDNLLADMVDHSPNRLPGLDDIKSAVAEYFGVEVKDLESKRRMAKISSARQVAMYLCRELTQHSLKEIAHSFAKDHASVVYAVKTTKAKCEKSESLKNSVDLLRRRLKRGNRGTKNFSSNEKQESRGGLKDDSGFGYDDSDPGSESFLG